MGMLGNLPTAAYNASHKRLLKWVQENPRGSYKDITKEADDIAKAELQKLKANLAPNFEAAVNNLIRMLGPAANVTRDEVRKNPVKYLRGHIAANPNQEMLLRSLIPQFIEFQYYGRLRPDQPRRCCSQPFRRDQNGHGS